MVGHRGGGWLEACGQAEEKGIFNDVLDSNEILEYSYVLKYSWNFSNVYNDVVEYRL
jgi:hypothetical protein